jgi:hypothetical protein
MNKVNITFKADLFYLKFILKTYFFKPLNGKLAAVFDQLCWSFLQLTCQNSHATLLFICLPYGKVSTKSYVASVTFLSNLPCTRKLNANECTFYS